MARGDGLEAEHDPGREVAGVEEAQRALVDRGHVVERVEERRQDVAVEVDEVDEDLRDVRAWWRC